MSRTDQPISSPAVRRKQARLRLTGAVVLALGIAGAGIVYWCGSRSPDLSDDPMMAGYGRNQARQMAILYGRMGLMAEDLLNALKEPGNQATAILGAAVLVSGACFYLAGRLEDPQ